MSEINLNGLLISANDLYSFAQAVRTQLDTKQNNLTIRTAIQEGTRSSTAVTSEQAVVDYVSSKIGSVYSYQGTISASSLSNYITSGGIASNVGNGYVFNIDDPFTLSTKDANPISYTVNGQTKTITTCKVVVNGSPSGALFIGSHAGKTYPAGTNVAVVHLGNSGGNDIYIYDVLSGSVDLSDYICYGGVVTPNATGLTVGKYYTFNADCDITINNTTYTYCAGTLAKLQYYNGSAPQWAIVVPIRICGETELNEIKNILN